MKVAMILDYFPVLSETFVLGQITGLIDRGHHVDIYADSSDQVPVTHLQVSSYRLLDRTYYKQSVPKNRLRLRLRDMRVLASCALRNPQILSRVLGRRGHRPRDISLELLRNAQPLLRSGHYDIIHSQFETLGLRYMGLRRVGVLKGALVTSFRGYDISLYLQRNGENVYRQLFDIGDLFLPNCDFFKRRLLRLGCPVERIVVHPSGIDCKVFSFVPRQFVGTGHIRIVTVARLVEKKGIEYAIRAVAGLAHENSQIKYWIIGDGPLRESLNQLINALQLGKTIKLLGRKSMEEIAEILKTSHIFVAPSVTSVEGDQEGVPNALKEAMAVGLPVVSTWHAGIPELVEDGVSGFLVPEKDVNALTTKLRFLIEHPEIWPTMGRAGRS